MPTSYSDQFYFIDPSNTGGLPLAIEVEPLTIIDEDDDSVISIGDTINSSTVTGVYEGDSVTVDVPGQGTIVYTGTTFYLQNGDVVFTPTGSTPGQVLYDGTVTATTFVTTPSGELPVGDLGPRCFVQGTRIETPRGPIPVEDLTVGDLVLTLDRGAQPIRALNRRIIDADTLSEAPKLGPVQVSKGALGGGLPTRDLLLSPQHRVLMRSRIVERMYGVSEVLAPVAQLTRMPGIERVMPQGVTYIHLVLDDHEVLISEGAPTETLLLGPYVHETLTEREMAQLDRAFAPGARRPVVPARVLVKGSKLNKCLRRHLKNGVDLVEPAEECPVRSVA